MATDIELADGAIWLIAQPSTPTAAGRITCWAQDVELDGGAERRKPSIDQGMRRALVHAEGDKLTVNFGGDYSGGVEVGGKQLIVRGALLAKDIVQLSQGCVMAGSLNVVAPGSKVRAPFVITAPDGQPFPRVSFDATQGAASVDVVEEIDVVIEIQQLRALVATLFSRLAALEATAGVQ